MVKERGLGGACHMRLAALFVPAAFLLMLLVGCGGSSGSSAQEEQGIVVGEFVGEVPDTDSFFTLMAKFIVGNLVGEVPDTDAFFALVAEGPDEGGEERNVRAYLCDGKQLSEWFVGTANDNSIELTSLENGLELSADLYLDNATSTIVLQSGQNLSFEVPLAEGVSGFYPVGVPSAGGSFSATSFRGAVLKASRSAEEVNGTLTLPENGEKTVHFRASDSNIEEGEDRWIVLAEEGQMRIKGAKRQASSSGYIDPVSGFKKPEYIDLTTDL